MYRIVGADRTEYGPASSEQIRQWISEGRANGQTMASFEGAAWKPLSTFPEFADVLRATVPPAFAPSAYPAAGAVYPGAQTNTMAVTGLVLCVLGMCCSPLSLIGLILCVIGLSQIQRNPQLYTTTKVVPVIGIVIALIFIVLFAIGLATGAFSQILRSLPR